MPQTAWTIQIRMQTASTAPKMFGQLAGAAKSAGPAVETVTKNVKAFGIAAEQAEPQVSALTKASRGLGRAYGSAGRAATMFSTVTRTAAAAANANFDGLKVNLDGVRATAESTAYAVRGIAVAARSIPRNISMHVGANGAGGSSSAGINPATLGAAVGGAAAGSVLFGGVQGAAGLQGSTLQAAIAMGRMGPNLGATTDNMASTADLAFAMSKMTGQNIGDSMNVIAAMTSAGVSPDRLGKIYRPIAQFTDIMHFGKDHMEYGESAKLGAGLAHEMRLMNSPDTAYGLGRVAQLGYLSPHGTPQLATQVRRMASMLENILPGTTQQKTDEIIKLAAWSDRMGNLPFAGSAIGQMTTQMISPRSKRVLASLEALGVYNSRGQNNFWNAQTGTFDVMGALMQVNKTESDARLRGAAGPAVQALFGGPQNMQRIMMALTSKESLAAYSALNKQMSDMGTDPVAWMNSVQIQLMQQLSSQTLLLKSNFETLQKYIGNSILPGLTAFVKALAKVTGDIAGFVKAHPGAARVAATGLAVATVAGAVASLVLGGYVAGGLFHGAMKHLNPGLAHKMGEAGTEAMHSGLGGVLRAGGSFVRGAAGRMSSVAWRATGAGAFGSIKGFFGGAKTAVADLVKLGPQVFKTRAGFMLIGETLAKIGLRSLPVVGEVLMLVDTIRFLGNNSYSIGKLLGMAAHAIWDALTSVWHAITGLVAGLVHFATHPGDWVNAGGNVVNWFGTSAKNFGRGLHDGWSPPKPVTKPQPVTRHPAHKSVAYVGGGAGNVHHTFGPIDVRVHGGEMSAAAEDRLSKKIGERIAAALVRETQHPHGGTQTVATDNYGGSNYHSAYGLPA